MADKPDPITIPEKNPGTDFPAILPALLVKELRQGLRTKSFIIMMILVPVVMSFPFMMACFHNMRMEPLFSRGEVDGFFWAIATCSILLINPVRALWSIYQEKSTKSSDLLVLTHLSSRKIIFQKWTSYALQTLLLLMIFFPFLVLRYFLGGVELFPDIIRLGFIFVFSLGLTAISLWFSGMPILYRVICALAVLGFCILIISFNNSEWERLFPLSWKEVVVMIVVTLVALWISALFIILSARNFSPPSENLSAPLRKLLLWVAVPVALFSCSGKFVDDNDYEVLCGIIALITCLVYGAVGLIELVQPVPMRPVLVANRIKGKGIISRVFTPVLLPGWQSAALFLLVGVLLFFYPFTNLSNVSYEKWDYYLGLGMTTLASALFIVIILQKIFQKVKVHALFLFLAVVTILSIILGACFDIYGELRVFALFPIGSMVSMSWRALDVRMFAWIFVCLTWLLYLLSSYPFWKNCWSIAAGEEKEANSSLRGEEDDRFS